MARVEISEEQVREVKAMLWAGSTLADAADATGVATATVFRIKKGAAWPSIPWPDGSLGPIPAKMAEGGPSMRTVSDTVSALRDSKRKMSLLLSMTKIEPWSHDESISNQVNLYSAVETDEDFLFFWKFIGIGSPVLPHIWDRAHAMGLVPFARSDVPPDTVLLKVNMKAGKPHDGRRPSQRGHGIDLPTDQERGIEMGNYLECQRMASETGHPWDPDLSLDDQLRDETEKQEALERRTDPDGLTSKERLRLSSDPRLLDPTVRQAYIEGAQRALPGGKKSQSRD